ncbi:hypothetical protein LRS05_15500 [Flavobacterium sp. J372]|uniref:hypothetical protein n=1 Tax=Flavobacterium sp. J372 TaxID=2898436 RepID=UPI002150D44C|nr:hypothetical protein [Flavobacterium sp. J372]MCR5863434.1 hypothetical protein [Flavobacterium sp. J372]
MTKEDIVNYIKENTEKEIYYEYLLGQKVWYFQNNGEDFSSDYDLFKRFISKELSVPFNSISIIGSAKTRYSFSPDKNFSEFNEDSDFDLIIVSNKIYNSIWEAYKSISYNQYLHNYTAIASNIFNGFVSLKDEDRNYGNKILLDWQKTILKFKAELQLTFNIQHEINYRIYTDWQAVEDYHLKGISKLKSILNETN